LRLGLDAVVSLAFGVAVSAGLPFAEEMLIEVTPPYRDCSRS
jgi:hypothetical protein